MEFNGITLYCDSYAKMVVNLPVGRVVFNVGGVTPEKKNQIGFKQVAVGYLAKVILGIVVLTGNVGRVVPLIPRLNDKI